MQVTKIMITNYDLHLDRVLASRISYKSTAKRQAKNACSNWSMLFLAVQKLCGTLQHTWPKATQTLNI